MAGPDAQHTAVEPLTRDGAEALLEGGDAFPRRFGHRVADGYLEFPEALPAIVRALRDGVDPGWWSHLVIDPRTTTVIGHGGFKGPPTDGSVEIGYSIAPAHRGRGHATEAAHHLIDIAATRGVARVCAHTLAEENPSTAVLRRLGFRRTAELTDPGAGAVWRWELVTVRPASEDGWVEFDAPLELLPWGRNTYTVLLLDDLLEDAVAAAATRRVEGRLDEVEVNLGVNRADVSRRPFLYIGAALQRRLDARAGDVVACRLRPADPDHVPVPADVQAALEASGRQGAFARRRPAERRRLLQPVEDAAQEATRRRRIEALVRGLPPT
ncbi:GNAT family N-acetyltransferase [Geodermatophilus pulveris]|nr:GNAT family N-acetyltransferase [Geodermatophilus pulveris]